MPTVLLFSGQGSQYYQMGRDLYDFDGQFRALMSEHDRRLSAVCGYSLLPVLYGSTRASVPFRDIRYTHLGIYLLQYCLTRLVESWGLEPSVYVGYSSGEICALACSNTLSFEDGAVALYEQVQLLREHCEPGAMLAVLASVGTVLADFESCGVELAGVNGPSSCVASGAPAAIGELQKCISARSVASQLLPVEFAFHSRLIEPIRNPYLSALDKLRWRETSATVLSPALGARVSSDSRALPWRAVRGRVEFARTVQSLTEDVNARFWDMSPSPVLANLLRRALPVERREAVTHVLDPYSPASMQRARASLPPREARRG
jgi:acyl transferase domain-containing protein